MGSTGFRNPQAHSSACPRYARALQHRALGFLNPVDPLYTVSNRYAAITGELFGTQQSLHVNTLTWIVSVCVCLSVTDVTSLPQRILWERGYTVYCNAYSGNESPNGRHGHLYRAIVTVIGGLRRRDRRH